jgi:hypothetical protein
MIVKTRSFWNEKSYSTLKMEAAGSSESLITIYHAAWGPISKDRISILTALRISKLMELKSMLP